MDRRADRRMDITKLIGAFRVYGNAPKTVSPCAGLGMESIMSVRPLVEFRCVFGKKHEVK
jgi:hypothetical protein